MSGVIDEEGQQWEHCNECYRWVRIQSLWYEKPSEEHTCGRDLCAYCYAKLHGKPSKRYTGVEQWLTVEYQGSYMAYLPGAGFMMTGKRNRRMMILKTEYDALEWINYYILNAYKMQLA